MPIQPEESTVAHIATPPPSPHHYALAVIILALFPPTSVGTASADEWFVKHAKWVQKMLQMVTREVFHTSTPSSYLQLRREIHALTKYIPNQTELYVLRPLQQLDQMPIIFSDIQQTHEVIESIPNICFDTEEGISPPSNRVSFTSPLGRFLRRLHLSNRNLTFPQALAVRQDVLSWCAGDREGVIEATPPKKPYKGVKEEPDDRDSGIRFFTATGKGPVLPAPEARGTGDGDVDMDASLPPTAKNSTSQATLSHAEMAAKYGMTSVHLSTDLTFTSDDKRWNALGGVGHGFGVKVGKRRKVVNKLTEMDATADARIESFRGYEEACRRGDYAAAVGGLEKFFSYRFPGNDKTRHHHALLQLASFHYSTGGLDMAKEAVDEATKGARTAGDLECLKHCMSLTNRLKSEMEPAMSTVLAPGQPPHVHDLSSTGKETPMDEIWGIKQRLDLGESLPSAHSRIYRALGRQQAILKAKSANQTKQGLNNPLEKETEQEAADKLVPTGSMADKAILHSVQANLWDMAGSDTLSTLHSDLAFEASTSRTDIDLNLAIMSAKRAMRAGNGKAASSELLEPSLTRNMTLQDYQTWSQALWEALAFEHRNEYLSDVSRARMVKSYQIPVAGHRQIGIGGPTRVLCDPSQEVSHDFFGRDAADRPRKGVDRLSAEMDKAIEAELYHAAPLQAIPHLLSVAHTSAVLGMWRTCRTALVRLADAVGRLEGTMNPYKAKDETPQSLLCIAVGIIEPIIDQVLRSGDNELICTSSTLILRRAVENNDEQIYLKYKPIAKDAALRSQSREKMMDVLMIIAMMEDSLGNIEERDQASASWLETKKTGYPCYGDPYTAAYEHSGGSAETDASQILGYIEEVGNRIVCGSA